MQYDLPVLLSDYGAVTSMTFFYMKLFTILFHAPTILAENLLSSIHLPAEYR